MAHNRSSFLEGERWRPATAGAGSLFFCFFSPAGAGGPELCGGLSTAADPALDRSEARRDGGFKHNNWSFSLSGDDGEGRSHDVSVVSVEEMDRQQLTSPEEKKGLVLQGRHFQHAQTPSALRKPAQSLDLKERNDFSTTQQAVEVDSIVLTCPDLSEDEASPNVKRRLQQKRKPLEDGGALPLQARAAEVRADYITQKATGRGTPSPRSELEKLSYSFYQPATPARTPRGETLPVRIVTTRGTSLTPSSGRSPPLAATSSCYGARSAAKGKRAGAAQRHELNDPSE
ncbi:hypothetical protein EYF80_050697 [Liparis tanakae]|uniref:Uncharacterized protein n=1 Tax=Liparis tanakae TaxID=230148 RepID=A0A4Z2FEC5_9TELE|nr:hypothetical protein EYF80_050697 [Liparis tanakae]